MVSGAEGPVAVQRTDHHRVAVHVVAVQDQRGRRCGKGEAGQAAIERNQQVRAGGVRHCRRHGLAGDCIQWIHIDGCRLQGRRHRHLLQVPETDRLHPVEPQFAGAWARGVITQVAIGERTARDPQAVSGPGLAVEQQSAGSDRVAARVVDRQVIRGAIAPGHAHGGHHDEVVRWNRVSRAARTIQVQLVPDARQGQAGIRPVAWPGREDLEQIVDRNRQDFVVGQPALVGGEHFDRVRRPRFMIQRDGGAQLIGVGRDRKRGVVRIPGRIDQAVREDVPRVRVRGRERTDRRAQGAVLVDVAAREGQVGRRGSAGS